MKNAKHITLVLIAIVFGMTSMTAQSSAEKQLTKQIDTFYEGLNEHDASKLVKVYDTSGILVSHTMQLNEGHDQIAAAFNGIFGVNPSIDHKITKMTVEGNMAVVLGEFQFRGTVENNNFSENGRFLFVFKKFSDGQWRAIYDMDNRAPDVDITKW